MPLYSVGFTKKALGVGAKNTIHTKLQKLHQQNLRIELYTLLNHFTSPIKCEPPPSDLKSILKRHNSNGIQFRKVAFNLPPKVISFQPDKDDEKVDSINQIEQPGVEIETTAVLTEDIHSPKGTPTNMRPSDMEVKEDQKGKIDSKGHVHKKKQKKKKVLKQLKPKKKHKKQGKYSNRYQLLMENRQHNKTELNTKSIENENDRQNQTIKEKSHITIPKLHDESLLTSIPKKLHLPSYHVNLDLSEATLPFLNIQCGDTPNINKEYSAVLDSGAAISFLQDSLFRNIPNSNKSIKGQQEIEITMGCGNVISTNSLSTEIPTTFYDDHDQPHTVIALYLVVKELSENVFLGSHFLLKQKYFKYIAENHLHFRDIHSNEIKLIPFSWRKTTPSAKLRADKSVDIPPKKSVLIPAYPSRQVPEDEEDFITQCCEDDDDANETEVDIDNENENKTEEEIGQVNNNAETVENDNNVREDNAKFTNGTNGIPSTWNHTGFNTGPHYISILHMRTKRTKNNVYNLLVTNNSDNYMRIDKNTELAKIQSMSTMTNLIFLKPDLVEKTLNDDVSSWIPKISLKHLSLDPPTITDERPEVVEEFLNARTKEEISWDDEIRWIQRQLDKDVTMNEAEKKEALNDYIKKGYYQHTVTSCIDKNSRLTEMRKTMKSDSLRRKL